MNKVLKQEELEQYDELPGYPYAWLELYIERIDVELDCTEKWYHQFRGKLWVKLGYTDGDTWYHSYVARYEGNSPNLMGVLLNTIEKFFNKDMESISSEICEEICDSHPEDFRIRFASGISDEIKSTFLTVWADLNSKGQKFDPIKLLMQ